MENDYETIAMNILDFLAEVTAGMNEEQALLFTTGYMYGLAVGDEELFDTVTTLAAWEKMMNK